MKLYYSPGACSLSPHIVLREAGLAFEPVLAPTKTHQLPDGTDYYTINPNGYVPTHNLRFSQPLTGDAARDLVGNRSKRRFGDRVGRSVGAHTDPYRLQVYRRDTGQIMFDCRCRCTSATSTGVGCGSAIPWS